MADAQLLSALVRIPLNQVVPGSNARGAVGDVAELAQSIRVLGMQKPLLVCDKGDGVYEVLDGHRRLAAAKMLDLPFVDAVLRRDAGEAVRLQQQLAMHAQALAFDPIAEARALSALMFDHGRSREQIAEAVGKSPSWVRDRLGLLLLEEDEQRDVSAGRTSLSEARSLASMRRIRASGSAHSGWSGPRAPKAHCSTCCCEGVSGA